MERRSFLKGLFGTGLAIAVPTGIVKASEVVKEIKKPNKPYDLNYRIYSNHAKKLNSVVDNINPLLNTMWKSITKGKIISNTLANKIRYYLDDYQKLIKEFEYLQIKYEFSHSLENYIYSYTNGRGYLQFKFLCSILEVSEGKYNLAENLLPTDDSHYSKWFGNVLLRYDQKELSIKHFNNATRNYNIKRFIKSLESGKKVKLPPMYEIPMHEKLLSGLSF